MSFGRMWVAVAGLFFCAGCGPASSSPVGIADSDASYPSEDASPSNDPEAGAPAKGGDAGAPASKDAGAVDASRPDGAPASSTDGGGDGGTSGITPGLHVVMGTGGAPGKILDGAGKLVQLHGADRSGTEFACLNGTFADGPTDQAGLAAMKAWKIDSVRVPMNEDCWLGINGVPSAYSGAAYQSALAAWVNLITSNGMVAIIDLHWTAPGTTLSNGQEAMADADHAPTFWSQVAKQFSSNGLVVFDLFNEPFITDWGCWVSGGNCATENGSSYNAAGMATLLKAVRDAGANNVVILGGLAYSSDMSSWVSSVNSIPGLAAPLSGISIANVAASWHAYDFNGQSGCPSQYNSYASTDKCNSAATTAANTSATSVLAAGFPLIMGESGISVFSASTAALFTAAQQSDLESWYENLLTWTEQQGQSYLAWSWNTDTDPVLVVDYTSYAPTVGFGVTYQAHLKKF